MRFSRKSSEVDDKDSNKIEFADKNIGMQSYL